MCSSHLCGQTCFQHEVEGPNCLWRGCFCCSYTSPSASNAMFSTDPHARELQFGLIDNVLVSRLGPAAPVLSGITRLPSGDILLNGLGIPHTDYTVQAASQLTGGV